MSSEVVAAYKDGLLRNRAAFFMEVGLENRDESHYQERPVLLALDLAYMVMAALCAAEVAGVKLDVESAVTAGRELYEQVSGGAGAV